MFTFTKEFFQPFETLYIVRSSSRSRLQFILLKPSFLWFTTLITLVRGHTQVTSIAIVICIWPIVSAKRDPVQMIKYALCLNRCNFRTVHAVDFLFSTLHTTPFQYVNVYFGILHKLRADVTRPDSPWGSKMPHFQVGASKSF